MKRSKHNLSHYHLTTFDQGQLVPVGCVEVLPGDTFQHSTSAMLRASTLVNPVMHPVTVRIHHWYVPNRVIWPEWEEFITGKDKDAQTPLVTYTDGSDPYELLDHFGVPKEAQVLNALPVMAYNKIYNENYRDQDIHPEVDLKDLSLKRVTWAKDRFTAARTDAQMGDPVPIPVGGIAQEVDVQYKGGSDSISMVSDSDGFRYNLTTTGASNQVNFSGLTGSGNNKVFVDMPAQAGSVDINDLRRSLSMQRFLEHRARFGSRYVDHIRALGIRPSDARVNEPEYLGGGKQQIAWSEVLATAEGQNTSVGDMAGHGIAAMRTRRYRRFFEEWGHVISLAYIRPKTIYMQSLNRMWFRTDKDEYWHKEYEGMGPQEIYRGELYAGHGDFREVFGYYDRHCEYREHDSYVSGDFRNTTSDSWHLARKFTSAPTLNQSFLDCHPTDRVYADTNQPEVYGMFNHRLIARRLVSKYARY